MSSFSPPDNQGMSFRLAAAVAEEPGASLSAGVVAAGLFAIAASLDRLTKLLVDVERRDTAQERAAVREKAG